jgi:hypothetical protein
MDADYIEAVRLLLEIGEIFDTLPVVLILAR